MIDTAFDFRSDSGGRDPDSHSPELRRYHRLLWSKSLPDGTPFDLVEAGRKGSYELQHRSELGDFRLSSDIITTRMLKKAKRILAQLPPERLPRDRGYTIGSALLFPKTALPGRMTINQARGWNPRIADRFDLTLECIRRHYVGGSSPLSDVLSDYADFFALFENFTGYVDFWLLQDLVDGGRVRFWIPFDDFRSRAVPQDVDSYLGYLRRREDFISARCRRIDAYAYSLGVDAG